MDESEPAEHGIDPDISRWIFFGMIAVFGLGGLALWGLRPGVAPPPPEIASDRLLVAGRSIYLANCANCHGERGRGDGPLARTLAGPPPRDFSDVWKFGEAPEKALAIVTRGAPDSAMPGWEAALSVSDRKAVTAYVYHLGKKAVPKALR